jgi:organic radical activating enzyme
MTSIVSRLLALFKSPQPLEPGIYHWMTPDDAQIPYRLHLRVEQDGTGVLIVNAATVLHLNPSATEHALQLVEGVSEEEAAKNIALRYDVDPSKALLDQQALRERVLTLATNPDVDPVVFLELDRAEPYATQPSAPYRLDLALTYRCDPEGALDPLARRQVDRELDQSEWEQILTKIWEAGIPHITFTGGEPTLIAELRDLIAYGETLGQVTGLLTNGKRLVDKAYMEELSQAGLDHILIAIDLDDSASQQGLRNAIDSDVFTAAHLTFSPKTIGKADEHLEKLTELGVKAVSISGSERSKTMEEGLANAREKAALLGLDLIWDLQAPYSNTNPISLELESVPEGAGRAWLYVEPDGDVLPSQGVDRVLGNLLRDSWSDIWLKAQSIDTPKV